MKDFVKISKTLWQSARFTALKSADEQLLFIYFLASPHSTSAGVYRLPDGYATADLKWEVERYQKARAALIEAGMVEFDAEHSVIFIPKWFLTAPPMNKDHLRSIRKQIDRIPSPKLREAAASALNEAIGEKDKPPPDPDVPDWARDSQRAPPAQIPRHLNTPLINGRGRA
jgi:hypothetical protein